MKTKLTFAVCGLALMVTGCHRSLGPRGVARDRPEYGVALAESWKEQTLLNIVKIRYADPPMFLDVGNIVSSYSLSQTVSVGGAISTGGGSATSGSVPLGASGTFSNSPTVTYVPLTGSKFVKNLMVPLPPDAIFLAIQSGQPADAIMFETLASINGLRNQEATFSGITPADPGFHRARVLLRKIQQSGAVRLYLVEEPNKRQTSMLTFRTRGVSPETLEDISGLRRVLGLNPDATEFKLVFGAAASDDTEVAVLPRSILMLMQTMAAQVEVPPEDVTQTRAMPGFARGHDVPGVDRLIRIHSAKAKPADAFVSVYYRNTWFWIDDGDLQSKQVFSLITTLFAMVDTNPRENLPVVTIPAR